MLQQTQATRVAERFAAFLVRFPTAASLAAAPTAEVLAAWNGLGYNRRAIALQRAAVRVTADGWPTDIDALRSLPGVGPYTARALASLAFGRPAGAVDTNVRRWLVRRFGARDHPRDLQALADGLATSGATRRADPTRIDEIATWTHASMELGETVCRARNPRCDACPVARGCPSRHRAIRLRVPQQARFRGSTRAQRGALVRALAADDRRELTRREARRAIGPALDEAAFERLIAGLERDGLVHRSGGRVRLGPRAHG
jgi:A/G-specific adenine glycosylase